MGIRWLWMGGMYSRRGSEHRKGLSAVGCKCKLSQTDSWEKEWWCWLYGMVGWLYIHRGWYRVRCTITACNGGKRPPVRVLQLVDTVK